ncbi:MAG: VanZ family protein [Bacteroidales bacterium]|nr:VanZ family protein [Bacteroidales bacterium]
MLKKFLPAAIWSIIILVLTGIPGSYIPRIHKFWGWIEPDKLVHITIFGILMFLILYGLREKYFFSKNRYWFGIVSVLITSVFGMITEILQLFVFVGRSGSRFDFYADAVGALIGWVGFYFAFRKKIRNA